MADMGSCCQLCKSRGGRTCSSLVAVLRQQGVVKILAVHLAADGLADQRANHQDWHQRKLVRHFKHDEDARDRRAHHRAQAGAHAHHDQRQQVSMCHRPFQSHQSCHQGARHAAKEQRWGKNSAATAEPVTAKRGDEFCDQQPRRQLPADVARQRAG